MRRAALSAVCLVALTGVRAAGAAEATGEAQGAHVPDEKSRKKAAAEQARLQELVRLSEKAANPAALIPHFRKLANKAVAHHVRREAAYRLGAVCLGVRKTAEAERLFDDLSRSGDDTWAWKAAVELGGIRRARGDPDAAIEAYERILRKNGTEREAVIASLAVAEILVERGDRENARKALAYGRAVAKRLYKEDREALKDTLKAMARLARSLDREKKVAEKGEAAVLLREGNAALGRKDYETAVAKYSELLERFADSKEAPQATVNCALCHTWRWRLDKAEEILVPFVCEEPKGPYRAQALIVLGDIALMGRMNVERALKHYGAAAAYEVGMHSSWQEARWRAEHRCGAAYFIVGDADNALKHFRRARKLVDEGGGDGTLDSFGMRILAGFCEEGWFPMPEFLRREGSRQVQVTLMLADLWYESLDLDRAARTYALVLDCRKLGKQASREQLVYAWMMTGVVHDNRFEADKAIDIYEKLIKGNVQSRLLDEVMFRLGCVMFNQKRARRHEAARIMIELSRRRPRSPRAPQALYSAAWMLAQEGSFQEARAIEAELRSRYPKSEWAEFAAMDIDMIEDEARGASGTDGRTEGGEP